MGVSAELIFNVISAVLYLGAGRTLQADLDASKSFDS